LRLRITSQWNIFLIFNREMKDTNLIMPMKKTAFSGRKTIRCGTQLIDLSQPRVMGIINSTPDSFYAGSRHQTEQAILQQTEQQLAEGATFIDIGGHSTRPGAETVPRETEWERTIPAIRAILKHFPETLISIDTYRSSIARAALDEGAVMVNDVSGGNFDEAMFATVANYQVPYIIMHMQGTPQTMQQNPHYEDVTQEIIHELSAKVEALQTKQVNDIIIDPGFGFGKNLDHNFQLLRQLAVFQVFDLPIMAGLSRKSMIKNVLDTAPSDALNGTTVLNTLALMNGAHLLRVHDVQPAAEAIALTRKYLSIPVDEAAGSGFGDG